MADHGFYKISNHCNIVGELESDSGAYCVYCTNRAEFYHLLPIVDNIIYDRRNDSLELYVIAVYKKKT